jgi:hypothetical protein
MPQLLRSLLLTSGFLLSCAAVFAQTEPPPKEDTYFKGRRIVGINMTPLLTQLVPFNRSSPRDAGPYLAHFKWYNRTGRTAFRMSIGVRLREDTDVFELDDPQLNFAIGWEKRRNISRRWSYTRGFDFMFLAGDQNIPGSENNFDPLIGFGPAWGIEWAIEPHITLGTEATLAIGIVPDSGPQVELLPPVGIYLHYYFK